jgi:hypothetical protein
MLKRIKIAQIGDIHLPSSGQQTAFIDSKDPKFPPRIKNIISRSPLKTVFRRIYDLIEAGTFDSIVFMGDLTDTGSLNGYQSCSRFISNSLQIGTLGKHNLLPIGIVPGNHDIDRELARISSLSAKFAPLNSVLTAEGLPKLPLDEPFAIELSRDGIFAKIFLINSCWGCGEEEFIPEFFRKPIADAIANTFKGPDGATARRLYYDRQLDTPAISQHTISKLINAIMDLSPSAVPIIVGHHNLFPQRTPRLAPYTELVNSGALRRSLEEVNRPTIFLHGHIHDDPIEIISRPNHSPLIVISAPAAADGFNILEIIFTTHNAPLICSVEPYRFDASGILRIGEKIKIPLIGQRRRSTRPEFARFYGSLLQNGQCYWQEVASMARGILGSLSDNEIGEQLLLLNADGRISIENYEFPFENWIIQAVI